MLFDARALSTASGFRGIGMYQRSLLTELARDQRFRLRCLAVKGTALPEGVDLIPIARRAPGRYAAREHEVRMTFDTRRAISDVFHSPSDDAPRRPPRPYVQTLFDVIPLVRDDPDLAHARRRWARLAPRYRSADAVIAISRFTADEGIRVLGLDSRRIEVAPLAAAAEFQPGPAPPRDGPPYVLLVGEYSERKGFETAFDAIAVAAEAGLRHELHLAGRVAPSVDRNLRDAIAASPRPDRIRVLGYVHDLVARYRGADAVVLPSRYEGFGLPAIEALATGRPLIAYANTAIVEVIGDAGVMVADGDVGAFGQALRDVLSNERRRDELTSAALEQAARFSWRRCAEAHAAVYLRVADE